MFDAPLLKNQNASDIFKPEHLFVVARDKKFIESIGRITGE